LFVVSGPVEFDPEYQLIVRANNLTVEIDNEISKYNKSTSKHSRYSIVKGRHVH